MRPPVCSSVIATQPPTGDAPPAMLMAGTEAVIPMVSCLCAGAAWTWDGDGALDPDGPTAAGAHAAMSRARATMTPPLVACKYGIRQSSLTDDMTHRSGASLPGGRCRVNRSTPLQYPTLRNYGQVATRRR